MKDLIIIGGGIAGITAAIYAQRAGLDFTLITKELYSSGQIESATVIENYPCLYGISGVDFGERLQEHLKILRIDPIEDTILKAEQDSETKIWTLQGLDNTYQSKTVIFAGGAKHRELNVPHEGVPFHYCATCDGALYKDKVVAVIGGGNVAFTEALYLSKICKRVEIVMCDQLITAEPAEVKRVNNTKNIYISMDYPVERVEKFANGYGLVRKGFDPMSSANLLVDGIFIAIGMIPEKCPWDKAELTLHGYVLANEWGRTRMPGDKIIVDYGFYAAGDARSKRLKQSITAAADGANCVASVLHYLEKKF